jgi:hypothetical protein
LGSVGQEGKEVIVDFYDGMIWKELKS